MSNHLRIKICGVKRPVDARQAAMLGADAIGLNFHPPSPRYLVPQACESILRVLPPFVEAVGVFVEQPLRNVFHTLNQLGGVRTVQWYGSQRELWDPFPYRLIMCFPVTDRQSLVEISRYLDMCRAMDRMPQAILVDAAVPGQHGGTGQPVPWGLLSDFRPGLPVILAGGLTPENVAEAVRMVRPYGVDVASGVEERPGVKDVEKMRRFISNAREAAVKLRPG
jgi:phosphoribosylanthranilate isomerase